MSATLLVESKATQQPFPLIAHLTQQAAEAANSVTLETDLLMLLTWLIHHTDAARHLSTHLLMSMGNPSSEAETIARTRAYLGRPPLHDEDYTKGHH